MLTVSECRKILGETTSTDEELEELLKGIRQFCNKFLDEYFANPEKYNSRKKN